MLETDGASFEFQFYYCLWAAMTKYLLLGGLNNRHLSLTVLEAGKSKTKALADLVLGEGSLPGWQTADFLLCPHMAERKLWCLFSFL